MSVADKRAALELQGLNAHDREWVLARLPSAEQARVRPLLAELDQLDVRFDIGTVADSLRDGSSNGAAPVAAPAMAAKGEPRSAIREASSGNIVELLEDEPAWVVDAVLALDDWPWSAEVGTALAQRGIRRSQSPGRDSAPLPPALSSALLALVAERLRGMNGQPRNGHAALRGDAVNGIRVWHRVWPRVKQWLT
jgi:hypothetical protein